MPACALVEASRDEENREEGRAEGGAADKMPFL